MEGTQFHPTSPTRALEKGRGRISRFRNQGLWVPGTGAVGAQGRAIPLQSSSAVCKLFKKSALPLCYKEGCVQFPKSYCFSMIKTYPHLTLPPFPLPQPQPDTALGHMSGPALSLLPSASSMPVLPTLRAEVKRKLFQLSPKQSTF